MASPGPIQPSGLGSGTDSANAPDDALAHPPTSERWRPGLDGLRAIAVLAVMAYHEPNLSLRGGFLGVDLFFVLSGFLITGLLLDERRATGTISLRGFWNRRGRRLLPALAALLVIVVLATRVLGDLAQRHDLPGAVLGAVLYVSNWLQISGHHSYFEQFASISPLRHLWSLAIEEQFYVVWPVVVALALRRDRRTLIAITIVATIASIVLMAWLFDAGDPSRAYYGTETRAFSLLIGALGAIWAWHRHPRGTRAAIVSLFAGVAVVLSFLLIPDTAAWMYRGGFAVFAVIALVVIIAASGSTPLTAAMSHPLLRRIGALSYALYLWHWPVRVLLTDTRMHLPHSTAGRIGGLLIRLALTFLLAITSLVLIERPVRRTRLAGAALAGSWIVLGAIVVTASMLLAPPSSAIVARTSGDVAAARARNLAGGSSADPTLLVVGDSVAITLSVGLDAELPGSTTVIDAAELGCALLTSPSAQRWDGSWGPDGTECADHLTYWRDLVDTRDPDVVVLLSGAWDVDARDWGHGAVLPGDAEFDAHYRTALGEAIDVLASRGATVVVVEPPCFAPNPGEARRPSHDPARVRRLAQLQAEVLAQHPAVVSVPLQSITCDDGFTWTREGVEWRPDGVHFSPAGARLAARWLLAQLPAPVRTALQP